MCRAIAGSFQSGTSRRLRISREPNPRSSSISSWAMRRKENRSATPFTWCRNHGKLSTSVPSRSKMASSIGMAAKDIARL
jgi:hypothetical protein